MKKKPQLTYARAVFKYKGQNALDKARKGISSGSGPAIDLSDVSPQTPIPKSKGRMKEGASEYTGVSFNRANTTESVKSAEAEGVSSKLQDSSMNFTLHIYEENDASSISESIQDSSTGITDMNCSLHSRSHARRLISSCCCCLLSTADLWL